jgi:acyl-CoA thioesterase FadM
MQILDDGPVLDTEIDSLGHMNVRFYLNRVDRANRSLLQKLGLNELAPACTVRRYDT